MKRVFKGLGLFLALGLVGAAGESSAQRFPNKSIKFVVGLAPGGGTDILARLMVANDPRHSRGLISPSYMKQ